MSAKKKFRDVVIIPQKLSINVSRDINSIHYFRLGSFFSRPVFDLKNEKFNINFRIVSGSSEVFRTSNYQHTTKDFSVSGDGIYFHKKKDSLLNFKLAIKNINKDSCDFFVSKQYYAFLKYHFENVWPAGVHMADLLSVKAIMNGDLVVYGASVFNEEDEGAITIFAPPGTGKTSTVSLLVQGGYKFLAEDAFYYDGEKRFIFSAPLTSSWEHHKKVSTFGIFKKIILSPFLSLGRKNAVDIFGKKSIKECAKLKRVYILEKSYKNKIEKIDFVNEVFHKVLSIQRNMLSYYKNPLLRTFNYYNANFNIEKTCQRDSDLLMKMLKGSEIFVISGKDCESFYKLINENERRERGSISNLE